jgi:hypothetical protein
MSKRPGRPRLSLLSTRDKVRALEADRKKLGLTITQYAMKLGISPATLCNAKKRYNLVKEYTPRTK